ncbi:MAG: hypothetical protein RMJ67_07560 [Elusimicrobiota bacterium]|nr:hypothetical protein [Endomicrobiia bacterium]MDW7973274.1 hypothetical protein [Thermodesulfovibrio sp.]MDW8166348.1 hypothetical protein [Elusimicrobiota bacterium]
MRIRTVFDPFNYGLTFVADFIAKNPDYTYLIIVTTNYYHNIIYNILYRYKVNPKTYRFPFGIAYKPHTFLLKHFAQELEASRVNVVKIIDFFVSQTFYRQMALSNKRQTIFYNYVAYSMEREGLDNSDYKHEETYEKFKTVFRERKIVDDIEIYKHLKDKQITPVEVDYVFVINAEDLSELAFQTLTRAISCREMIVIGDHNKLRKCEYEPAKLPPYQNDLIGVNVVSQELANLIKRHATEYKFEPYVANIPISVEEKKWRQMFYSMLEELDKCNTAKLLYPDYSYQYDIEKKLFDMSIPFRGFVQEYEYPFHLYTVINNIRKIINSKNDMLNKKEILSIIDMLAPRITDRFGGRSKLKKMFYEYLYPSHILAKLKIFETVKKMYFDNKLEYALKPPYCIQYLKWHNKLNLKYARPKLFVAPFSYAKNINTELTFCIYETQAPPNRSASRSIYTALTSTTKRLILCPLAR